MSALLRAPRAPHCSCNICGARQTALLANRDRYGFAVRTALCLECGLIYLVDRLSLESYSQFYSDGTYRSLTGKFNAHNWEPAEIQVEQAKYATGVIKLLEGLPDLPAHGSLLDVGGSAGAVAAAVASRFQFAATVLDPAAEEIVAARALGVEGVVGSLETYQSDEKFHVILLCRSIEHLFDLKSSLLKIRDLLQPGGVFYCDAIDFFECCESDGAPEVNSKIDHCYWLSQQAAPGIFAACGFEIAVVDLTPRDSIRYVLRACEPQNASCASDMWIEMARRLRAIDTKWRQSGEGPHGALARLHDMAYRAKRRVVRLSQNGRRQPSHSVSGIARSGPDGTNESKFDTASTRLGGRGNS